MSDSTLKELWQQVAEKKSCEAKQKELTSQRDTLADRLKKLEKSKLAEQADVDRLEGHSLAAFFYQVIGKMDEKMDKERQEAYAARVKYDAALHDLSSVDADLEQIQNRLERLSDCERQYQAALSEKIKSIKASAHPAAQQVAESESRIAALKVQKRELLEAINAGKTALHTVNEVLETLDNAEGWSTWDVMGGGLMADLAKYEELDDAQEQIEQLQVELRRFKTELCNGVQREHNKKLNNGLPILHKVPPKRDYGRYFCIMAEKGGTSHGGLTEKLSPFFMPKNRR